MKTLICHIFLILTVASCSSKEKENYKTVVKTLQENYNNSNYEAIFNGFNKSMQEFSNLEKTTYFFAEKVKRKVGNWITTNFKATQNKKQVYTIAFEKGEAILSVQLDKNNKIAYLLLKEE